MTIVYIAHPISGDVAGNLKLIVEIVRQINLEWTDVVPLVPYYVDLLALRDDVAEERQRGIDNDTAILRSGIINELWLYGRWATSKGCLAEMDLALDLGITVVDMYYYKLKHLC